MSCLSVERRSSSPAAWLRKSLEAGYWPASRPPTRLRRIASEFPALPEIQDGRQQPLTTTLPSLASFSGQGPDPAKLGAPDFTGFVTRHAHQLNPGRARLIITALHLFARCF